MTFLPRLRFQRTNKPLERKFGNDGGQRAPAVAIAYQRQKTRADARVAAAIDFLKTDRHRQLIFGSGTADAPAQIDRLKG